MGCCRNPVVVGEVKTERCVGDGGEGKAGLYTPRRRMNQKFEHGLVTRASSSTFESQESNPMDVASLPQVRSSVAGTCPSANSDRLSHARIHSRSLLSSLHTRTHLPQPRKKDRNVDYRVFT